MSQATSQEQPSPLRVQCACEKDTCSGEVVSIDSDLTRDVYVRCAPVLGPTPELDFEGQARRFYGCLPRLLEQGGADMSEVAELGTVDYGIRSLRPATHRPIDDLPRYTQPYIPAHQRIGPIH